MKVGTAKVNITPPIGTRPYGYTLRTKKSTGIHDELYAKVLVLDDGEIAVAVVSADLVGFPKDIVKKVRESVGADEKVRGENIIMTATHNHNGPTTSIGRTFQRRDEAWTKVLEEKIAGAISAAIRNAGEARIGASKGHLEGVSINRRYRDGPVDPEVGVIRVEDKAGNPLAILINFTCHPAVVAGHNLMITAGYPGFATSLVENVLGGGCVSLFTQGACGNVNPWDFYWGDPAYSPKHRHTFAESKRLGTILGSEALKVAESLETFPDGKIGVGTKTLTLPMRETPSVEELELMVKEARRKLPHHKIVKEVWDEADNLSNIFYRNPLEYELRFSQMVLEMARSGIRKIETEVKVLTIDDACAVCIPGELFVELGLEIKERSDYENAFIFGYANDYVGYLPTLEATQEAGLLWHDNLLGLTYGTNLPSSKVAPEAVQLIVESAVKLARA